MEKTRRRRWTSRVLVVGMCVIVALMGFGGLVSPDVAAKGGGGTAWVPYQGPPKVYIWIPHMPGQTVNLIRFYCDVFMDSGYTTPMTAEILCNSVDRNYGNERFWADRVAVWSDASQMWLVHERGGSTNNFPMLGSESYNIQFNYNFSSYSPCHIDIPFGRCLKSGMTYINGASNWPTDMVGWYSSFYTPPENPPPPPPPPPGHTLIVIMASDWMKMVRDGHMWDAHHQSIEYTTLHMGRLICWNATVQDYQVYLSWDSSSDFVVYSFWADRTNDQVWVTPSVHDGIQMQLEAPAYFLTNPQ